MTTKKQHLLSLVLVIVSCVGITVPIKPLALAAKLDFIPSITVSERYDDNIFFEKTDGQADYITSIGPRLTASYGSQAVKMTAGLGARFELFSEHTELNKLRYRANLGLNIARIARNTSLSVSDVFRFTPEPPAFIADEEGEEDITTGGIRIPRGDSLGNVARIRLTRRISSRSDGVIGYTHTIREFEDPTLIDSTEHKGQVELRRKIGPRDTFSIDYRYQLFKPDQLEESESHTTGIRLNHQFSREFSIHIGVGGTYVTKESDDALAFSGSLGLNRSFKRTRIGLRYSRAINATSGLSGEPAISQVASATINRNVTRRLGINLSQNYATNRSTLTDSVDLQSWRTRVRLTLRLRPWLRGEAEYRYFSQTSEGIGREFRRSQALVGFSANLP